MTADPASTIDPAESDPRWRAVVERDAAQDGRFVYSVRTTGVYCRPSCASRRAKRENVAFHATTEAAEAAGFRACKRCRPKEAGGRHADKIARACRMIEQADEPPTLDRLAEAAGLSAFHFHRAFKAATGLTPKAYADAVRAGRVRENLGKAQENVTSTIYASGFNSNGRFYESADRMLGMTPGAYRDGGRDAEIRFAIAECSLGSILVAASQRGVCAILLGDDPDALARALQDRFPKAELIGGEPAFEALVAQVIGFVEAPGVGLDLPLDIRGTAFQQRVWTALRDVPMGETVSYAELARRMGEPKAARAVGMACGANMIAVAIPCHRVVRADGGLSGYRWGAERKQALIDREKAAK
ncbi:bifunctional DNA-binding transcriptional regulator/O6-methylguanine-DNA methyltransferase Ada [Chenggangzhangella methanolivorans]|uniref:methylated-DNA--[protein]-cysteine S-methyltransferase n=2 Tax=Chenggangzhangella methanolivorans TaxID=1437009 RepID=A0A9E6REF4_9HYPH|nr:bifunctional DNA-binding transcriptional regulator/O6-methylguanine-DNA methyltransferase Ada [Chenggangzhangella methanolivorans]QZO02550.1 bifunctional DNA-binding transcriptional regulator/O6-methylguanine-DNA methyltransferase Ada [Chenggangzhangella methanolivorans]